MDDGPTVGKFCLIANTAKFGNNVTIKNYACIGENTEIGSNCTIGSYNEIRDGCKLGDNVSTGSRCTLSANTIVGNNVIMKYSFVATDTPVLGSDEKSTNIIEDGAMFGANVTIMPGVRIGKNSIVGACSQVRHDVPPNEVWYGNPAHFFKGRGQ